MKGIPVLLTIVLAFSFFQTLSNSSFAGVPPTGDSIAVIRSRFATINKNLKRYKKVQKDLSGYSAEGGTLEAYIDGGSVKKLVARFFGEMGKVDEDYYFWNGKLIFVFRKEFNYDQPLSGKVVSTEENRFYFENDRMIRWVDESNKQVLESDPTYPDKQKEHLESAREFVGVARS